MIDLISKLLISESRKLSEAFSAQNKRAYQREYDRIKDQLISYDLNPDDFVKNDARVTTGEMRKIKNAIQKVQQEKELQARKSAETQDIQDQIDDLYDQLEAAGKQDIADELLQQSTGKEDPNSWLLDQYKSVLDPEHGWEQRGKDLEAEMPRDMPDVDKRGHDIADFDVDELPADVEDDSNIRRFKHMTLKIMNLLDISRVEMASLMNHLNIDSHIISNIFPTVRQSKIQNVAHARAAKKIQNADPEVKAALKNSLSAIMQHGTYKLGEDIVIMSESGVSLIPAGTKILIV